MRTIQKEYRILQVSQEKLQFNYDELKGKCDNLKLEARESAQEVMKMETVIDELTQANEKLQSELDQAHGQQRTSEDEIIAAKKQVEEEYRAKLAYKETEIEGVNHKLSRISQTSIEYKTKCERLETANGELLAELEQTRERVSTLEMELEMTKVNAENDAEKQLEQVRAQLNEQLSVMHNQLADKDREIQENLQKLTAL